MSVHKKEQGGLGRSDIDDLVNARHADPFAVLGAHADGAGGTWLRAYLPEALSVQALAGDSGQVLADLQQGSVPGLFTAHLEGGVGKYCWRINWAGGEQVTEDPYSFGPQLGDMDLYLFSEGNQRDLANRLGAQPIEVEGIAGVRFSVWAPNAKRVSVVGPFNNWDGRRHPMRLRHASGVWELFIPGLAVGETYKYEVLALSLIHI